MAKLQYFLPALAAFCLLAAGIAAGAKDVEFHVQGRVYCDNCRAGFETNITEYLPGATVRLECQSFFNDTVAHLMEGVTDADGYFRLAVPSDHEEEICYVKLIESPRADCAEVKENRERARVLLTENSGQSNSVRYANNLGFLKEQPLPVCAELLKIYKLDDETGY
ncbi:Pollen-specific protein C13 [Apostasia shenzhenica]|uniref:Pollen-specific protein C13 n=1 Tax=Apostasia shenzhenica TaxID=1088818 RepID=A0A2H9ZZB2_9ASPA|nr:Pollen-specific protein C13 [Apostasia shenzhenica]